MTYFDFTSAIDEKSSTADNPSFVNRYKGELFNGKFHGKGRMLYNNGDEYKGKLTHWYNILL